MDLKSLLPRVTAIDAGNGNSYRLETFKEMRDGIAITIDTIQICKKYLEKIGLNHLSEVPFATNHSRLNFTYTKYPRSQCKGSVSYSSSNLMVYFTQLFVFVICE